MDSDCVARRHTDLSKDLMSRAAVRKLLLDVASLALAAEHTEIVNYAARLISQGMSLTYGRGHTQTNTHAHTDTSRAA